MKRGTKFRRCRVKRKNAVLECLSNLNGQPLTKYISLECILPLNSLDAKFQFEE